MKQNTVALFFIVYFRSCINLVSAVFVLPLLHLICLFTSLIFKTGPWPEKELDNIALAIDITRQRFYRCHYLFFHNQTFA